MTARGPATGAEPGDAGFTLIEMLVGVALLALISSVLVASIDIARKALAFVERSNAVVPVQAVQTYLRFALAQARPIQRSGGASSSELSFHGTPTAMTFTTSYAPRSQLDGLYRMEIKLEAAADQQPGLDLYVTQTLVRPPAGNEQAPPPVASRRSRLLDHIRSAEFGYYGALGDDGAPTWRPTWAHLDKLPRLVAIDVRFAGSDSRDWQRLIVPLYVSDSSSVPCPPRGSC